MRHARLLLALCTMVFLCGCDSSIFDNTPWWHWLLFLLLALAGPVVLIAVFVRLLSVARGRAERRQAFAEALTPVDYLLWGVIGGVLGAVSGGFVVKVVGTATWFLGDPAALCGAIMGAGIAIFLVRRRCNPTD